MSMTQEEIEALMNGCDELSKEEKSDSSDIDDILAGIEGLDDMTDNGSKEDTNGRNCEFLNQEEINGLLKLGLNQQYIKELLSIEQKDKNSDDLYLYKQKLKWLDDIPNEVIVKALRKEPFNIIALILLLLEKKRSAEIFPLLRLDEVEQVRTMKAIATGFSIDESMVYLVIDGLKNSIIHTSDIDEEFFKKDFDDVVVYDKKMASYILNRYGVKSHDILHSINAIDPELAWIIKDNMFEFDDIFKVFENQYLYRILSQVEYEDLSVATYGKDENYRTKLKNAMSQRARDRFDEEIEMLGRVKAKDIKEAEQKILNVAKRLLESGEIERDLDIEY
jgi:flagellar motor switch protein FliG